MTYEEYTKNKRAKAGRPSGKSDAFTVKDVYKALKAQGRMPVDYWGFRKILELIGKGVWDYVYQGRRICIPELFNMEVIPNEYLFTKSVDWKRTEQLWQEDEEAFNERMLVRNSPQRLVMKIYRSTLSFHRSRGYYPLVFRVKLYKSKIANLEDKMQITI